MSSIFKKLSVILCCLFGLISINPATLAKPGDYLVYFLGKDEKNVLMCGGCSMLLRLRSGQFCCPNHCFGCAGSNMWGIGSSCNCSHINRFYWRLMNSTNIIHQCIKELGPFCFINYEHGGNIDIVFKNAKESKRLYCAHCMAEKLNGNFDGKVYFDPSQIFSLESSTDLNFGLLGSFKLDANHAKMTLDNTCYLCQRTQIRTVYP